MTFTLVLVTARYCGSQIKSVDHPNFVLFLIIFIYLFPLPLTVKRDITLFKTCVTQTWYCIDNDK